MVYTKAVDVASAETASNYQVEPDVVISGVSGDEEDDKKVTVTGEFKGDTSYMIIVSNVIARDEAKLDPENNFARFTTGESE